MPTAPGGGFSRMDTRQKAGALLGLLLFLGLGLGLSSLPGPARWAAATVALMSVWWITEPLPLWATALLPLLIYPLAGIGKHAVPVLGTFPEIALQYADPINLLFIGGMMIAGAMEEWNLHRRLALGIVARVGATPRRLVLGFMLATGFITLWIANTTAALMMFPIAKAVLARFEEEHGRDDPLLQRFGLALMLGIAYAASIGGTGTKIGTGTNLVFVKHAKEVLPHELSFVTWLEFGMPLVLIALPLVWLYLVRVAARLPETGFAGGASAIAAERTRLGRLSCGEWVALLAFLAAAGLWVFQKDIELGAFSIPGWWDAVVWKWKDPAGKDVATLWPPIAPLWPPLDALLMRDFGDAAVSLAVGGALLLIPVQRAPLHFALPLRRVSGLSWPILALLGGGFAMAYGIESSGLSGRIGGALAGLGRMNPFVAMLAVCYVSVALTEVASNTATANILLPLIAAGAKGLGLHPAPLMIGATLAASFGFMLPAGTPPNAIVFSSGYISVPQMVRSGIVVDLCGALLVALVAYFIAPWALGIPMP